MIDGISHSIQSKVGENFEIFGLNPLLSKGLFIAGMTISILAISMIAFYTSRFIIARLAKRFAHNGRSAWMKIAYRHKLFHLTAYLVPLYIIYTATPLIDLTGLPYIETVTFGIQGFISLISIMLVVRILFALLNSIEERSRQLHFAQLYSIKSYIQVFKLVISIIAIIFAISILINKSPAYFLASLGAMTAVILLVFKDSILGFVASIQLAAYDIARIGDWVEIPSFGANGDVIDISLNTIKVQNFDKTIVTIPSHALLNTSVTNWRGMSESGGRRIKRHISVDVNSVKFCDNEILERLHQIPSFRPTLEKLIKENQEVENNEHNLTNIGMFRAYLEEYIATHNKIRKDMTCMVRQLQANGEGIPLELYIFTNDTRWVNFEKIQADIFEHIYAMLPLFDLSAFQHVSGNLR